MPRSRPALLLPALALNLLIASATFLVAKRTVAEFPPLTLALFRFVLATLVLWPVVRLLRPDKRIAREDRGRIVLLGIVAAPLNQGLFLLGMKWTSASHGALMYALTPALVAILLARVGGVRPRWIGILGIVVAFAGVLLLLLQRGLHFDRNGALGDLLVAAAVVAWAVYLVAGRPLVRRYGPLVVTSEALLAGTLVYLPIGLLSLPWFHPSHVSITAWLGLLFLAWLTSGLNYVLWFWGLQYLKPATVAMITNLQPIVTAVMARLFLGELLPGGFIVSTALVLAGVWLTRTGTPEAPAAVEEPAGSPADLLR